jgi:hypothetical protein
VKHLFEHNPNVAGLTNGPPADETAPSELLARLARYEARAQSAAGPRPLAPSPVGEDGADDPVTPELALVDPALASRERLRLPEPPAETVVRDKPGPAIAPAPAMVPTEQSRRRQRPRWRRVSLVLAVLAVAGGLSIAYAKFWNRQPAESPTRQPVAASTTVVPAHAKASPPTRPATRATKPKSKPKTAPPPKRQRRASHRAAGKRATTTPSVPDAGRTFAWVPSAGARYYLVEFYRGRREILRASPSAPRLVLPPRWSFNGRSYRLTPGTYRWSVRPGFGPLARHRYGKPIVQAKLVVQRTPGG